MSILFNLAMAVSLLVLAACGNTPQVMQVTATSTPLDLCSSENLPLEVDKLHRHMREFDDASLLAANTPRDQLPPVISDMQKIRRNVEDQIVPPCLATLKNLQLAHQNTVITTLVAFLGGAEQAVLREGTALASAQHNEYALEYARLLGLTVVVPPTYTAGAPEVQIPITSTPVILAAKNPGPGEVNLYSQPSVDSTVVAALIAGGSARVIAQSADGQWIQVEIPGQAGQSAWVQSISVTLSPATP